MTNHRLNPRLVIFGLLTLVIVGVLHLVMQSSPVVWTDATRVPNIFLKATAYKQNTLVLSNGRQFVTYNYKTGRTEALSQDDLLEGLEDIDNLAAPPNGNYLVFRQQLAPADSLLDKQLRDQGLDSSQSYWWLYSVHDKSFHNFPATVTTVRIDNSSVYTLENNQASKSIITTYSPRNLQALRKLEVASSVNFYPVRNGFLLEGSGEESSPLYYTTDGVVNKQIFLEPTIVLNIDRASGFGVITSSITQKQTTPILFVDTEKGTSHQIGESRGQAVADSSNDVLFTNKATDSDELPVMSLYEATTKKTQPIGLKKDSLLFDHLPAVLLNSQAAVLSNNKDSNYLVGNDITSIKQLPTSYQKSVQVGKNVVDLKYFEDESAFIITLNGATAEQERAAVYKQLSHDGFNPELLEIRFTVFTPPTDFPSPSL